MKPALFLPPGTYQQVQALADRVAKQHGNGTPEADAAWQSGLEELLGPGTMKVLKAAGALGVELRQNRWIPEGEAAFVDLDEVTLTARPVRAEEEP